MKKTFFGYDTKSVDEAFETLNNQNSLLIKRNDAMDKELKSLKDMLEAGETETPKETVEPVNIPDANAKAVFRSDIDPDIIKKENRLIRKELANMQREIDSFEAKINEANVENEEANRKIAELENKNAELLEEMERMKADMRAKLDNLGRQAEAIYQSLGTTENEEEIEGGQGDESI